MFKNNLANGFKGCIAITLLFLNFQCGDMFSKYAASKNAQSAGIPTESDTNAPTAPGSFLATPGGSNQINLTWAAAIDDTSPQNSLIYEICQSAVSGGCATFTATQTTTAGATTASASGLNPLTTHYFKIRAIDQAGNVSATSTEATGTTDPVGVVNSPVFSPVSGIYAANQNVTISSTTGGAAICFTQGAAPVDPVCDVAKTACTTGTLYATTVAVASETLKAIACANGYTDSVVVSAAYTITTIKAATPVITPVAGNYTTSQMITINTSTGGATIYYTTDGSTPIAASNVYSAPFILTGPMTVKAIAISPTLLTSNVAVAQYAILNVAQVGFSPLPGNYVSAQNMTLSTGTTGASMYYTTDGTTPGTSVGGSTLLYSAPVNVAVSSTIKAIAAKTGYNNSPVSSASYTIAGAATYALGGWVSGLYGGTLVLQNNGGDDLTLTGNGPFVFLRHSRVALRMP